MVFGERIEARAAKGRVFLLVAAGDEIVEPPPSMDPITLTVNGIDYNYQEGAALTVLLNDPIPVVVTVGGPANPTYSWSARGNNATFSDASAASTEVTCVTEGLVTITCTLTDNDSLEDQVSTIVNFFVVDAI
jgi:hypothetical protein